MFPAFPLPAPGTVAQRIVQSGSIAFIRVKFQLEFGKTISHCCQKAHRFSFVLKPHHTVVCVTYKDDIASSMSLTPLVRPQIKCIVQIDVG